MVDQQVLELLPGQHPPLVQEELPPASQPGNSLIRGVNDTKMDSSHLFNIEDY